MSVYIELYISNVSEKQYRFIELSWCELMTKDMLYKKWDIIYVHNAITQIARK